jgi:hypothetical protein
MLADLLPHQVECEVEIDNGPDEEVKRRVGEGDQPEKPSVSRRATPPRQATQGSDREGGREETQRPRSRRDLERLDRVGSQGVVRREIREPRGGEEGDDDDQRLDPPLVPAEVDQ